MILARTPRSITLAPRESPNELTIVSDKSIAIEKTARKIIINRKFRVVQIFFIAAQYPFSLTAVFSTLNYPQSFE
jgi:hypothetical protein